MIREAIRTLAERRDIGHDMAKAVMNEIMDNTVSEVEKAAYLTALAIKGETVGEITGSAEAMRDHCVKFLNDEDVLEIIGTGGDKSNSFNISSTAALVIAAAGVPVAKHGSRASHSKAGAADMYEALGVNIRLDPDRASQVLKEIGMIFLFAQNYHIAMKYVGPVRKELGIRTVFDFLGPLANPAGATMELMGVYDESLCRPLGQVLSNLGVKRALVVYGQDSMDEISMSAPTTVCEVRDGWIKNYTIKPEDFGLVRCRKEDLTGGTAKENAEICRRILSGRDRGPKRDAVLINAGAALYMAGKENSIKEGVELAAHTIDCGAAFEKMDQFISATNQ
ncbi:MAG: anthranilate phosphoribosyltransferase [Eubacteriales bacterium]|nr:anthranilate phosphoribosyltransferase [Eubacteriales bacterium]